MQRRTFLRAAFGAGLLTALPGRFADARPGSPWKSENAPTAESAVGVTDIRILRVREKSNPRNVKRYLEVATDRGVSGLGGDLFQEQPHRLEEILPKLKELLVGKDPRTLETATERLWEALYPRRPLKSYLEGRDPLTGEAIWGTRRTARHTRTGSTIMALSAVDNALWDLRGRLAGVPVSRLLGGERQRLKAYVSLMPSRRLVDSRQRARDLFDQGFTSQKWFLRHGPPDGKEGFRTNVGLVEALRTELGSQARLMFDFAVGERGRCDWDVPYAVRVAKAIAPFRPFWLEEPFAPEEIQAYERLKGETDIALATGEHTYTRWNIQPFLDRKLVKFVQCDPEWCGGISELLKICALVKRHDGVRLIPHGHHILAASQVVAAQPETLCPMVEYGEGWMPGRQRFQVRPIAPEAGYLRVPTEPGLGPDLDWKRLERV